MKKSTLILLISFMISGIINAQNTLFFEDFESGAGGFTLNSDDLGGIQGALGSNFWVVNSDYTGGSLTSTICSPGLSLAFGNTDAQPAGISSSNGGYLHIVSAEGYLAGITNSNYLPPDGGCSLDASHFSTMTNTISTVGYTDVSISFWWLGVGSNNAIGQLYYSIDGGVTWTQEGNDLKSQNTWTQETSTNANWNNQTSLIFGYRFENNFIFSGSDPSFSVDDILIQGCGETTSNITETACGSYTSPSGNYNWTNSNIYMDTIQNTAGCDSVITINLTINNSVTGTDIRTECDSLVWIDGNTYYADNNIATFNIVGGAANSCDSLVTLNLTITTVNSSVTQSGVLLTADESGATYQWLDCPAMTPIGGATNQSYTATTNDDYAVIVTSNGCADTSSCYTVTGVGIIENDFGNELLVYPNPTDGNFSIDLGSNYISSTITVTDINGKSIRSNTFKNSQLLNLKLEEPAGVYLLIIESENKKTVIRVVKE